MKKTDIIETVIAKQDKYFDLVWLARRLPEDYNNPKILKIINRIKKEYPQEVESLSDAENGNWEHGFNSGVLAAMRYILHLDSEGVEFADIEFPMLDT
jgi:hypothetical protein